MSSLLARFLLVAVAGSLFFAVLAGWAAYEVGYARNLNANQVSLQGMVDAVEKTAAVGAYTADPVLLGEVVGGLARSPLVAVASVRAIDNRELVSTPAVPLQAGGLSVHRRLRSPFPPNEVVGTLVIEADMAELEKSARNQARLLAVAMVAQVVLLSLLLYAAVDRLVSRPIVRLAERIRQTPPGSVARLPVLREHRDDEIGVLVASMNLLLQSNAQHASELQSASAELLRRQRALASVTELSPDGIVVVDAGGRIDMVNRAFERLTGLDAAGLQGRTRDEMEALLARLCRPDQEDPSFAVVAPGNPKDSPRAGMRSIPLRLPQPRTLLMSYGTQPPEGGVVLYFRDATAELEVDRMKSDFLANTAHELRTPMTSVHGFVELLLTRQFDPASQREMLEIIHRQSRALIQMINEVLDLARIEARRGAEFRREAVELQAVVKRVVDSLLMPGDERRVALTLPDAPVRVEGDAERLGLALTNVLSNAYKYSRSGPITVDLQQRLQGKVPQVGIRVRDEGIGMTREQLGKLFERFFRADRSGAVPGTGLGANLYKEIIELHGGEVDVQSEIGVGTTVTLWLTPLA